MSEIRTPIPFDAALIRRYEQNGPRYTSYPTAMQFTDAVGVADYHAWAAASNEDLVPKGLSLYFHIPFCDTVCFYCACSKVATKDHRKAAVYLDYLKKEIAMQAALFDRDRVVEQLHWGGGTPTFLSHAEMRELMAATREHFQLRDDDRGEYSIEIDPRAADAETLALLREIGFNRVSLGVQDIDPAVQRAVNRVQPWEQTLAVMQAAREQRYHSINVDLIYGLPLQTLDSVSRTLGRIIAADPDRIALYNYAHMPTRFPPQRRIDEADLPSPATRLAILRAAMEILAEAGYVYIGMDHFAKPQDELALAQANGTLQRNFQGYSAHAACDLVAMGITAISHIGDNYAQNAKDLESYYALLDRASLPIVRGIELDADDIIRHAVIADIMCNLRVDIRQLEARWRFDFWHYFAAEKAALAAMRDDRLLYFDDAAIEILPRGRMLVRNIGMVFDKYLADTPAGYSKTI